MKRIWMISAIIILLLTACGSKAEPTMSPADVQGTAMAAAMTMVAATQAAVPTATNIPPTAIPSATPLPTNTLPSLLDIATATQFAPVILPTNTIAASVGGNDPCLAPLTSWQGDSAKMYLRNNTKPAGTVTLALGFTTNMGECGIISAVFDGSTTVTVPMGTFWASAFIDGPKIHTKSFGGDVINRTGNYSLWVENERIILKAGCAPNC